MYYPFFFSNKFELETVFKLKKEIDKGLILPIIEMFKVTSETVKLTAKILNSDTAFILIINPYRHPKELVDQNRVNDIINSLMQHQANRIVFGIYIDIDNLDQHDELIERYGHKNFALFHKTLEAVDIDKILQIAQKNNVRYNFFLDDAREKKYHDKLNGCGAKIILEDPFHKQVSNSKYKEKEDEAFYNLHIRYKDLGFDGFGDYLTIGSTPSDANGKQPSTVVIHYTYPQGEKYEEIWIKRFFGDINKEYEKLNDGVLKAMREAQRFIECNIEEQCHPCEECKDLITSVKQGRSYELGRLKQFSMMHHVNMMVKLLNS